MTTVDFEEEDALWRELRQFTGEEDPYRHPSEMLVYTEGVRRLASRARISWFVDLIASLQSSAQEDPALRGFQLWELNVRKHWSVAVCSRDETDCVFWRVICGASAELRYLRLYVVAGVLHLPTERWCRRLPSLRERTSSVNK